MQIFSYTHTHTPWNHCLDPKQWESFARERGLVLDGAYWKSPRLLCPQTNVAPVAIPETKSPRVWVNNCFNILCFAAPLFSDWGYGFQARSPWAPTQKLPISMFSNPSKCKQGLLLDSGNSILSIEKKKSTENNLSHQKTEKTTHRPCCGSKSEQVAQKESTWHNVLLNELSRKRSLSDHFFL